MVDLLGCKMKLTQILFNKQIQDIIQKIDFDQASQGLNSKYIKRILKQKLLFARYTIFAIVIIIEILLASTLSGWIVSNPISALVEWLVVIFTIIYFLKINLKSFSENYLTRFYSCCSIIFSIISLIFSVGLWIVLTAFSGGLKDIYMNQILIQTGSAIVGAVLVCYAIYKYLLYLEMKELAVFDKGVKIPLMGRIIDKFIFYGIIIVILGMQLYRMNKFWLLNDSSWVSTLVIPIGQVLLWVIIAVLLIALPLRFFYPEFVKSYLLQKYSEKFRVKTEMTEKYWYSE
ncbi:MULTISPECIES: hypothetical protein [Listeria]|uniref:hypothetical protein n=1 Tax=Listeria TaxID=1637 RepID=UPI000B58872D|nr:MULTISPECIES: hypothetical protein [Listeria]